MNNDYNLKIPYRVVFIDLDGTLLNSKNKISARTCQTIQAVRDLGVQVVLSSGRLASSVKGFCQELEIDTNFIASNGACLHDMSRGGFIFVASFDRYFAERLTYHILDCNVLLVLYHAEKWYASDNCNNMRYHASLLRVNPERTCFDLEQLNGCVKIIAIGAPEILRYVEKNIPQYLNGHIEHFYTYPDTLEFMPKHVSKGDAAKKFMEASGIDRMATLAFGDGHNDRELLQIAGRSYAMANASESIKALADEIAPSHDEDGVAQILEKLFPI